MNISNIHAAVSAQSPVAPQAAVSAEDNKKAEATRQFEAMLLRQVLGDALKPSPGKGLVAKAPGSDTYQSFVTDILADSISKSGALGFSNLLQSQTQNPPSNPR